MAQSTGMGTSTRSLHADDVLNVVADVAPPMHLSTTFRYSDDPSALVPAAENDFVCKLPNTAFLSSMILVNVDQCIKSA